jgi:MauM/NapG family ferredoxin protein
MTKPKRTTSTRYVWWRRGRQVVQALALILFLYLLLNTTWRNVANLPHDIFFRLDPLAGVATMLASRRWIASLALGGLTLALALLAGRAWCGWLCPLGTLLDWVPSRRQKGTASAAKSPWRYGKYLVLLLVLGGALLGSLALIVLDPITLLFRAVTGAILPGLGEIANALQKWGYQFAWARPAINWFSQSGAGLVLGEQDLYLPNLTLLAALGGVLALNAIRPRFWCRSVCPLGGLLGLFASLARLRHNVDEQACIECGRCATVCPTAAIDPQTGYQADMAECVDCLDCAAECPTAAIAFRAQSAQSRQAEAQPATTAPGLNRRQFLVGVSLVGVSAVLVRFGQRALRAAKDTLDKWLRPPGTDTARLEERCIRCGACVQVCPTGLIQPNPSPDGEGLWTPTLVMRDAYCDYGCNLCGEACPTGAIPELVLAKKQETPLGVAVIDPARCLAWDHGQYCIVCEEMCPIPDKAIKIVDHKQPPGAGLPPVPLPEVTPDMCIGCGICEYQCPVEGEAAIQVLPRDPAT